MQEKLLKKFLNRPELFRQRGERTWLISKQKIGKWAT